MNAALSASTDFAAGERRDALGHVALGLRADESAGVELWRTRHASGLT
jgi:hypothetical protein